MTPSSDAGTASSSTEESSPPVEVTFISGSQANADPRSSIRAKPPTQLGRYRIEKQLGEGAMGSVYLARDQQLNRPVALKVPHNLKSLAANFEERFLREARCAATLNHANICPVYEVGEDQGIKYLAMGYVDGRPLSEFIKPGKFQPERQIAIVVRKIALAVHEAHQQGIIHRDLKPANIMIDRRKEPIVMDFGLARLVNDEQQAQLTSEGVKVGTPSYMSPEQIDGDRELGPQSDVFSLGIILYELLTLQRPFQGSVVSVIGQILHKEPTPIRDLRPDVSPQLAAICAKALSKDPAHRYASMKAFADDLSIFLKGKTSGTVAAVGDQEESAWGGSAWEQPVGESLPRPARPGKSSLNSRLNQQWLVIAGSVIAVLALAAVLNLMLTRPTTVISSPSVEAMVTPSVAHAQPREVASDPSPAIKPEPEDKASDFPAVESLADLKPLEPELVAESEPEPAMDTPLEPLFAAEPEDNSDEMELSDSSPVKRTPPGPPAGPRPGDPNFRPPPGGPNIDEEMARFDLNEDGVLKKDELPPFVFKRADFNQDGKVTRSELERAYKKYRERLHQPPRGQGPPPPRS